MPLLFSRALAFLTPRRCRGAAIIFFVLMIGIGAVPGNAHTLSTVVHDKHLHFFAYAMLSALLYGGLTGGTGMRAIRTVAVTGLLGAIDEGIQALLPYREASLSDWLVDMAAGLFCGALLALLSSVHAHLAERAAARMEPGMQAVEPDRVESP